MVNIVKVYSRNCSKDKIKSLSTSFASLKSPIKADYFHFNAKKVFSILQKKFIYTPIVHYFDSECFFYIKTNISCNTLDKTLNCLNLHYLIK